MNGVELHPCPVCNKLKSNVRTVGDRKNPKWQISCRRCWYTTRPYDRQQDAESEWNEAFETRLGLLKG